MNIALIANFSGYRKETNNITIFAPTKELVKQGNLVIKIISLKYSVLINIV